LGVAAVALFAAPSGYASVTIGSDLTHTGNTSGTTCGTPPPYQCTYSPAAIPGRMVTSPVNGVVTSWSARWQSGAQSARFQVLRPLGGTSALFVNSGSTQLNPPPGIGAFATSQPISIGDRIGIDDVNVYVYAQDPIPGAVLDVWVTQADGATAPAAGTVQHRELLMNATIEPTTDFSFTTEARKKGMATVTVSVPNPGTLSVTSGRTKIATATANAPGDLVLNLRPTKKTRKKLQHKSKLKTALHIAYAASFATPITKSATLELKAK
jgi:hypothetical protein